MFSPFADVLASECCERKRSAEHNDLLSNVKRIKYGWHVELAPDVAPPSDNDVESIHSVQAAETVLAYDTDDTLSNKSVNFSSDDSRGEEYEPISSSDDAKLLNSSSSSEIPDDKFVNVGVITAGAQQAALNSDLADSSGDSLATFDIGIVAHYPACWQCHITTKDLKFPYCSKCYTERKSHLPLRSKRKNRRKKLSRTAELLNRLYDEPQNSTSLRSCVMLEDTKFSELAKGTTEDQANLDKLKCVICKYFPRNTGLVHNRSMHFACCTLCAKKVWNSTKRCPICNCKIVNTLRVFLS